MPIICITGTNRGIGLALADSFSQDHHVIAMCRKSSSELEELQNTTIVHDIDINMHEHRIKAISAIPLETDILFLNAGILLPNNSDNILNESGIIEQVQTNAISPLIMAQMASKKLKKHSKIILMTSRMGSITDNNSGGLDGYRMSKAALNAAGKNLAISLQKKNISVFLIHPGHIQTDMTNYTGQTTPSEVAKKLHELIPSLTSEQSGSFWHADGYQLPW